MTAASRRWSRGSSDPPAPAGLSPWLTAGSIVALVIAVAGAVVPLAPVLRDRNLIPLSVLVTATAVVALIVGLASGVAPGTVTGVGAGLSLTLFGLLA